MEQPREISWRIYVICFFSAFGGLTFGYDTGVLGVSIPFSSSFVILCILNYPLITEYLDYAPLSGKDGWQRLLDCS